MRRAAEERDRQAMVQPPDQPGSEDEQPIRLTPRAEVEAERNRIEVPQPSIPVEESGPPTIEVPDPIENLLHQE